MKRNLLLIFTFFLCFTIASCTAEDSINFNPPIIDNPQLPYLLVNKGIAFKGIDKRQLIQGNIRVGHMLQ